jgi:hypothetical protein
MERSVENKSWAAIFIRLRFRHNHWVKNHPRYLALLKRIGLDDESVTELQSRIPID